MLMIIIMHLEGHGGLLNAVKKDSSNLFLSTYSMAWLLETICFGAVNCYSLISGYVGWRSTFRFSKLIIFWIQVIFYSIGVLAVLSYFYPVTQKDWISSFYPIFGHQYWYATAYFGLLLLMPIFNHFIQNVSRRDAYIVLLSIFLLASVPIILFKNDAFNVKDGYSMLWLCFMYLLGGIISKFRFENKLSNFTLLIIFVICILLTWLNKIMVLSNVNLLNYTSPTIVFSAICLLCFFSRINITRDKVIKIISFFASGSFGVYLIHDNRFLRWFVIKNKIKSIANDNFIIMISKVFLMALLIYFFCAFIDFLRRKLMSCIRIESKIIEIEKRYSKA